MRGWLSLPSSAQENSRKGAGTARSDSAAAWTENKTKLRKSLSESHNWGARAVFGLENQQPGQADLCLVQGSGSAG